MPARPSLPRGAEALHGHHRRHPRECRPRNHLAQEGPPGSRGVPGRPRPERPKGAMAAGRSTCICTGPLLTCSRTPSRSSSKLALTPSPGPGPRRTTSPFRLFPSPRPRSEPRPTASPILARPTPQRRPSQPRRRPSAHRRSRMQTPAWPRSCRPRRTAWRVPARRAGAATGQR